MKMYEIFKFEKDGDKYRKTEKASIPCLFIERILGKVIIGKKVYEIVYLKNRHYCLDGLFLVDRKRLKFDEVSAFVTGHSNGQRSIQWHPYTEDLFDDELLNDVGMEVLTYKWYYSGNDRLRDVYYPVKKEEVTDELKEELDDRSKNSIEKAKRYRKAREEDKTLLVWEKCK